MVFLTFDVAVLAAQVGDTGYGQVSYRRNRFRAAKHGLPIFSAPAEKFINQIAIAPVFGGLDCPQNEHAGTTSDDRGCEKVFGDQMAHR